MKKWQCKDCKGNCVVICDDRIKPTACMETERNMYLSGAWTIKQAQPELATSREIIDMCQEIIKKLK